MSLGDFSGITVIDVMCDLGVAITPDLSWSVGSMVRQQWLRETGQLPDKVLRPKTDPESGGTHCFAVYPSEWRGRIAHIIGRHETDRDRQGRLFP
jgi:hypothetical protein